MDQPVPTKTIVAVVGATAVGKTDVAFQLGEHFQCPILSADSRQCYRELGIAVAKPSDEMLNQVKHLFIDSHSIAEPVTVVEFEKYALSLLDEIFTSHHYCILSGGSGLYTKAVIEGLDKIPEIPDTYRISLEDRLESTGLDSLVSELRDLDPDIIDTLDQDNPRRVIRALEVCLATGKPYSRFLTGEKKPRPFEIIKIGLYRERDELYKRIDARMDQMIEQGLFEEADKLYHYRNQSPLQTVGYREVFAYLDGVQDRQETIRLLKRNSRRYAKRQITWFGKDSEIRWFQADDLPSIFSYLEKVAPIPNN